MTITFTKKHLLILLLLSLFIGLSLAWYLAPTLNWLYGTGVGVIILISATWAFINRGEGVIRQKKYSEKKDQQLIKRLFYLFMQELKDRGQHKRKYRMPWYVFISKDMAADQATLTHMGFRNSCTTSIGESLPTQIWLKNDAVIISVQMSTQDYRALNCLKFLIKKVSKFRARQTLNGVICSQSIATLLSNDKNASQQMANDNRLVINEIQKLCGQKLPIYVLFNQMAGLADFCQFFASLNENKLEGAFGALNNDSEKPDQYQRTWFNKTYDDMCQQMGNAVLTALDSQLSEGFRRSVVAAPMQFKQIKLEVSYFLEQLLLNKNRDQEYKFRGFFFTNTEQQFCAEDPLTKKVAYQLGFNEMLPCFDIKLSHSIFVNHFFDDYIRPEASSAGINKKVKRLFWSFQIGYGLAIASLITSTVLLLKTNFDYYQHLNAKTFIALQAYEESVRKSPYDLSGLTSNIKNLTVMRAIYQRYNKETPFYISPLVPNPQLSEAVELAYHDELINILLPSMMRYLEDELFVYETLGDTLKTAQLLQLNEEMKIHDLKSWTHLKEYYRQSFLKEEHTESQTLKNFILLMDDLYQLGVPKVTLNTRLIEQSKASLDNINATQVLFDYIKELPAYVSKVDISPELGNNFDQLYQFKSHYNGKLVPYIYTPQGFSSIDLSEESELIVKILEHNKALFGHQLNTLEKSNLSKALQRLYQRNYINFWLTFIDNVSFKTPTTQNLNYSLSLLSAKVDGPQTRLYQAISYYTHPDIPKVVKPKEDESAVQAKLAEGINKLSQVNASTRSKTTLAKNIQSEFTLYHNFVAQDEKGVSELSHLQDNIIAVHQWLNKAQKNQSPGNFYFTQLITNKRDPSLYQLDQMSIAVEEVQLHINALSQLVNNSVNNAIYSYINNEWQQQVTAPFNKNFSQKFPFNVKSNEDVNFKSFNSFFKADGLYSQFNAKFLTKFNLMADELTLQGFAENQPLVINQKAFQAIKQIEQLQQGLYQQDPDQFSINYRIKNETMSAALLSFELFNERTIFTYQHGPKLWKKFNWPTLTGQNEFLAILTDTEGEKAINRFDGQWAWLKLVYKYHQTVGSNNILNIGNSQENTSLLLTVDGDINTLAPNFFSQISLPTSLL